MDSFRYVGATPTEIELDDRHGEDDVTVMRPIEPGEFTGPIDVSEDHPHNQELLDDGKLLVLESEAQRQAREEREAETSESEAQHEQARKAKEPEEKEAADQAAAEAAAATGGKTGESS